MKRFSLKYIASWLLIIVGVCSVFLMYSEFSRNKNIKVIFLDVGQGDATMIITPHGRQILIDAGKYPDISAKIEPYMPINDRSIDMVIATHPDIDHIAGFNTLLDEYQVEQFIHSGLLAGAPIYRNIANKVKNNEIQNHAIFAGETIILEPGLYLEILSPYVNQQIENPNDHSVVVRLVYKNHAIMLTGDASTLVEQKIVSMYGSNIESDILKMGHHGSKTSSSDSFVETVNPNYGIISAGCDNSYGHPHANVLRILDEHEVQELNTCENGDIVFEFIGEDWVLKN